MSERISEEAVRALLRDATATIDEAWEQARFVPVDRAERRGRVIVPAGRTTDWGALPESAGWTLRPYGVHQHTLIVGVAPRDSGVEVDMSRFAERTW